MSFNIPPATERAWAAGFFDGEGHCHYSKNPRGDQLVLTVVQTKETATLERFRAAVGGYGNIYERNHRREGWSQTWVIQIGAYREVQQAACLMWDFLSEPKRQQIAEALTKYKQYQAEAASRRPPGFRYSNQKLSEEQVLRDQGQTSCRRPVTGVDRARVRREPDYGFPDQAHETAACSGHGEAEPANVLSFPWTRACAA